MRCFELEAWVLIVLALSVGEQKGKRLTFYKAHDAVALSLDHLEQLPDEGGDGPSGHNFDSRGVGAGVDIVVVFAPPV